VRGLVRRIGARVACGVHGDETEAEESGRFQAPNLGETVRDLVGEMCPNPAPLLPKAPETALWGLWREIGRQEPLPGFSPSAAGHAAAQLGRLDCCRAMASKRGCAGDF
jgi:hypothetical protein